MGFWMDNAMTKPMPFLVVDCGYIRHQRSRDNADRLLKAIGINKGTRHIVAVVGFGRLVVRCPKAKVDVLKRFKRITTKPRYSWTTHIYDGDGPQFKLK